ncbi:MAG: HAD-IIA family hydrolase [Ignavibacteriaceae bacterium]|nr:HAD-IIA family hydrolase [Ignavibacteriaceae bacterium]MCU0364415.1 HAD-IIA family hydrolase [Ignavibacteriaceae bacterium]MCU0413121.1 HAD-IIA family hydrolase [Ignavibacteriaceae bacterium]
MSLSEKYDYFIFDLDGTIYRGEHLIPRADEVINHLKIIGKKIVFVSNKTTGTAKNYYYLLKNWGLNVAEDEIINSTIVVTNYLKRNFNSDKFFAIGEDSFIDEIEKSGLKFSTNTDEVKIVLVTLDRTLNYQKLEIAARALEDGAKFFAANIDDTCPVDNGEVIDAGSTISALEKRTHRKLELHFGKPSEFMFNEIKRRLQFIPEKTLLIGDRLETDITMGNRFGIDTALVSTGVKYFPNGTGNIVPTYQLNSVFDLLDQKA